MARDLVRAAFLLAISAMMVASAVVSSGAFVSAEAAGPVGAASAQHPAIKVTSDNELRSMASANGWKGDGSSSNPYVLENLFIYSSEQACVYLANTTLHLVIKNCLFIYSYYNSSWFEDDLPYLRGAYVSLYNAKNIALLDNSFTGQTEKPSECVRLAYSSNNRVLGNSCGANNVGVHLLHSTSNTIGQGHYQGGNFGVLLTSSDSNTVIQNRCDMNAVGIGLNSSHGNTIEGNECTSWSKGISLVSSESNTVSRNTCSGRDHGIYSYGSNDNRIGNNTCHNSGNGIGLERSRAMVENNDLSENGRGIHLNGSQGCTVRSNTCNNNFWYGIFLEGSDQNTIEGNTVNMNTHGMFMRTSDYNGIYENTLASNRGYGIWVLYSNSLYPGHPNNYILYNNIRNNGLFGIYLIDTNDNVIHSNSLVGNKGASDHYFNKAHVQAFDDSKNTWNHSSGGNYWGDWYSPSSNGRTFDRPYSIVGEGNKDYLPLVKSHHYGFSSVGPAASEPSGTMAALAAVAVATAAFICLFYLAWTRRW